MRNRPSLYMQYIALTRVQKLLDEAGAKWSTLFFRQFDGMLSVHLEDSQVDSSYTFMGEERLQALREEREKFITLALDSVSGAYCDRDKNHVSIYFEVHGVKVRINVGEALCERVQTGTRTVEKIDPDYLLDAPKVTVEEPVYDWRCSDDILGSMAHKETA